MEIPLVGGYIPTIQELAMQFTKPLTRQQISKLQWITSAADRADRYTSIQDGGYMNGPIVSNLHHQYPDGSVSVSIHNVTGDPDHRWFHTSIHVIAHISPRGKVRVTLCNGVNRSSVDSAYLAARVRRQIRNRRS